jgi:hypothetical protein
VKERERQGKRERERKRKIDDDCFVQKHRGTGMYLYCTML